MATANGNGKDDLRVVLYATINKSKSMEQLKSDLEKIKQDLESSKAAKIELKLALANNEIKKITEELKKIQPPKIVLGKVDDREINKAMKMVEQLYSKFKQLNEMKISFSGIDTKELDKALKQLTANANQKISLGKSDMTQLQNQIKQLSALSRIKIQLDESDLKKLSIKQIENELKQFSSNKFLIGGLDTNQLNRLFDLAERVPTISKELERLKIGRINDIGNLGDIDKAKQLLQEYYSNQLKTNAEITNFRQEIDKAGQEIYKYSVRIKEADGNVKNFKGELSKTTGIIREQETQIKKMTAEMTSMDMLANRFKTAVMSVPVWFGAMTAIYGPIQALKELMSIAIEVDKQMTEMKRVMDQNTNFDQVLQSNIATAKELSRSLKDVNSAYIEFVKQGLNDQQAQQMARAALLAMNVSDLSSEEAIQDLTAAVTQFKLQAKDAMSVVDKWNEVDNQFATTTKDIADAMAKSGAVAQTFGVSMDKMIGHITAIQVATKESGEVVGNSLKAIYQNIVGKPEAVKALEQVGIQVKENNGQMRRAEDILDELASKWNSLTDAERQNVAMRVAGTYQLARFTALMNNYQMALDAARVAENSAGSATRENLRYQQSFAAQIERLGVAWEELAVVVGNSGFGSSVQLAVSSITTFLEILAKLINTFGFFPTTIIPTSMAILAFAKNIRTMVAEAIFGKQALDALSASLKVSRVALESIGTGLVITALSFGLEYLVNKMNEYRKTQEQIKEKSQESFNAIINHGSEIKNLAQQYEQLSNKASKSESDMAKLNEVQNQLGKLMPSVVQEVDQNGQAHLMSAEAVKAHVEQAQKLAEVYARMNILDFFKNFEDAWSQIKDLNDEINDIQNKLKNPPEGVKEGPKLFFQGDSLIGPVKDEFQWRLEQETTLQEDIIKRAQAEQQAADATKKYFEAQLLLSGSLEKLTDEDKAYYETLIENNIAYLKSTEDATKAGIDASEMAKRQAKDAEELAKKRAALGDLKLSTEQVQHISLSDARTLGVYFDQFKEGKVSVQQFHDAIRQVGLSEKDFEDIVKQVNDQLDAQNKKIVDLATAQDKLKSIFDNYLKSTQLLVDAQSVLNQGQDLSLKQIFDLIIAYPQLGKSIKVQNGYLTIQNEAIQNQIDLQKAKLKADIIATKSEIDNTRITLKANIEKVKTELQMYDLLSKARQDNIQQIYKEAEAQIYAEEVAKAHFTGNEQQDLITEKIIEQNTQRRMAMIRDKISDVARWNDQLKDLDSLSKGLDTLAKNFDKVSNSLNGNSGFAKSVEQTIYIVDKFANAMGDLATRIKEVESLQKVYPKFSENYRKAIQQEIDLIKKKIGLLNDERASLLEQIKTGNIQPTGMVTIGGSSGYYGGSAAVASYYLGGRFRLTSKFGEWRGDHYHGGIDLAAPTGTPIEALIDGYVARKGYQAGGAGYYVVIADNTGRETKYFHMNSASPLSVGQRVSAGDVIGYVGHTGDAKGSHLHLEVWINGKRVDPLQYLNELKGSVTSGLAQVSKAYTGKYADIINKAAQTYGVDPFLIASVIRWESNFNPRDVSPVGAKGLMQLMPGTARSLGVTNPFDPYQNIMAGTKYLAHLLEMFGGDIRKALAAYNWGPGNVKRHPNDYPSVTEKYINHILNTYQQWTGSSYGSYMVSGFGGSNAELQQAIDEAKQKRRQLNDEYIDAVDQLMQLYQELVDSQIEWYKRKQDELDSDMRTVQVGLQAWENQDPKYYRYYLEQQMNIYKQKETYFEQEANFIADQLKNNKNLTDAYRAQLQMMHRDVKASALEMQLAIYEVKKKIADSKLGEAIDQFAKQFDGLSEKMNEIDKKLHMTDQSDVSDTLKLLKDKLRVYLEQRDAIKEQVEKLKQLKEQFKDYQEIVNRIDEELKNWNSTLDNIDTSIYDTKKQMKDVADKIANDVIDIYKQMYEKQRDLELKALDNQVKAAQEAHDKKMKMLDDEMKKYEDVVNQQLKLLDNQENQHQFERELNKRNEEIRKVQEQIDRYSLDNSLEARAKVKDLQDQLKQLIDDRDEFIHQHEVEQRRKSLQDMLDDKRKQIDKERNLENDSYDQQTKQYDQLREEINKKWENMLEDQRKFEEIRKQIIAGNIDAIKKDLGQFIDYIGKNTNDIGQSISNNLIDKIHEALDSLKALDDFIHNPKPVQLPNHLQRPQGMPSNYGQIYKLRHSKYETLSVGSEGDMVKKLQARLGIKQTGVFDDLTKQAVTNWQIAHGIKPTGEADDFTLRALGFYDGRAPIIMKGNASSDPNVAKVQQEWIKKLQRRLNVPVTGVFDDTTRNALMNWERVHGLYVDGIVDDFTWEALGISTGMFYFPVLGKGFANDENWVKKAQEALGLKQTGVFDEAMRQAVLQFQQAKGISPTGIIGEQTWKALGITDMYEEWDKWWEQNLANEQLRQDMINREDELWNIIADELGITNLDQKPAFVDDGTWNDIKDVLKDKQNAWKKIQDIINRKRKQGQVSIPENKIGSVSWWERIYNRIKEGRGLMHTFSLQDLLSGQGKIQVEVTDKNAKPYVLQLIMNIDKLTGDKDGAEKLMKEFIDKLKAEGIIL